MRCIQLKDGVEQIIYTDTNDNAHGVLEVLDDVYPTFADSQSTTTFFDDGTQNTSLLHLTVQVILLSQSQFTHSLCITLDSQEL